MTSSHMPSEKYSCSGSPLKLSKDKTAMDGLSGSRSDPDSLSGARTVADIRRAVKGGELPVYQIGAWPRVRWVDVIRWICSQRAPVTSHAQGRVAEILEREEKKAHK